MHLVWCVHNNSTIHINANHLVGACVVHVMFWVCSRRAYYVHWKRLHLQIIIDDVYSTFVHLFMCSWCECVQNCVPDAHDGIGVARRCWRWSGIAPGGLRQIECLLLGRIGLLTVKGGKHQICRRDKNIHVTECKVFCNLQRGHSRRRYA